MAQYCSSADFSASTTGAQTFDLPSGILDSYLQRASSLMEQWAGLQFTSQTVTLTLLSGTGRRVIISRPGTVYIYPRVFPINTVNSITWSVKTPLPLNGTYVAPSTQTIDSNVIYIESDDWGDGQAIRVFQDMSAYRDMTTAILWTVNYQGGYTTYPDWLTQAAILWTVGLLKRRGGSSVALTDSGQTIDFVARAGEIRDAQNILRNHIRYI